MKKKIVIAGGTGFLGTCLIKEFKKTDTKIIVLTRSKSRDYNGVSYIHWDACNQGDWCKHINGAEVIINMVGRSVNCRYTEKNKAEIINSRVNATKALGIAISKCSIAPELWINAGSAAIFGNSGDEFKNEESEVGHGFSPEVCKRWEQAFNEVKTPHTRKIFLRIGMVFQPGNGVLKPFTNLARLGLGGTIGDGNQYITWIHYKDFTNMIFWLIERGSIVGIVHCASPNPVPNKEFMQYLRKAVGMPIGLPNPSGLIKIGAVLIGTEAELILTGRRVISKVLKENKFTFTFPILQEALEDLI